MGVSFDHCLFCMAGRPVTGFGGRRTFDYAGVPEIFATMFKRAVAEGYPACDRCAVLIRAKDQVGLAERAHALHTRRGERDADEQRRLIGLIVNAHLWQEVFWLGLATDFGPVVPLSAAVQPATRVLFDLILVADPTRPFPSFKNGVDVYGWPWIDALYLEDLRSAHRGNGHASRVLGLILALADLHRVTLHGVVEAHNVDDVAARNQQSSPDRTRSSRADRSGPRGSPLTTVARKGRSIGSAMSVRTTEFSKPSEDVKAAVRVSSRR